MAFKGKKGKSIGSKRKADHRNNKKNTKFHRILVSPSSVRGQVQKLTSTHTQQQIISFFEPTPKSVSQSLIFLNKDAFKIGSDGKVWSNISERAASIAKHGNVKN